MQSHSERRGPQGSQNRNHPSREGKPLFGRRRLIQIANYQRLQDHLRAIHSRRADDKALHDKVEDRALTNPKAQMDRLVG